MPVCNCLCTWLPCRIVWWSIHGRSARQRPLRIVYLDLDLTPSTRSVVTHTDVRSHVKCLSFKLRERQAWDGELKNSFINRTISSPHLCGGDWLSNWLQESSGSPARLAATGHWHNKHPCSMPGPYPDLDLDLGPRLITAPHVNTCGAVIKRGQKIVQAKAVMSDSSSGEKLHWKKRVFTFPPVSAHIFIRNEDLYWYREHKRVKIADSIFRKQMWFWSYHCSSRW